MKQPIEPSDILAGDLIRWEGADDIAHEYRAKSPHPPFASSGQHYLLDRPTPPVDLPTKPTLGWIEIGDADRWLGFVQGDAHKPETFTASTNSGYSSDAWRVKAVTAFIPATAVPTTTIDELRRRFDAARQMVYPVDRRQYAEDALRIFLDAVDEVQA